MVYFDSEQEEEDDSSSYSSSTSSPSFKFRWDVFLSFIPNDNNFTDRLYKQLVNNDIRVFLNHDDDVQKKKKEEEIDPRLLTAIEDSAVSIAIISENYATSTWCLEELTKILNFRRLLLPVFYEVDPSHVRHQNGPFEEAFRRHEERFGEDSDEVGRWKEAMEKAGGISGWDSRIMDESHLIQSLVKKVLTKLSNTPLGVAKYPTGLDRRVQEVLRLLDVKSNGVQVVGFHGMGGIGKTTLAKAVYNKIVAQFEHRSFISDIRESSRRNGLSYLQNKLIRNLFPSTPLSVDEVSSGITMIKRRVLEKRVLIVLDDIDDVSQLDALAGNKEWYHEGSRIIITTRDSKVLTQHLVTKIYELKELDSTESLQLFSFHAFGRDKPIDTLMKLSEQVVSLTGGLPLALEVLGAFYFDKRRVKEWEDSLEKLKQIRPGNLHEVLKITFDGLEEQEKCIFLDIACFFAGTEMKGENIYDIFKGCGFNAEKAINVLTERSLIKVVNKNIMWMHDQLRDMGRQIVREESLGDPGMRSRLWDRDEIMTVLKYHKGTSCIQGIILDFETSVKKFPSKFAAPKMSMFTSTLKYVRGKLPFDPEEEKEIGEDQEVNLSTEAFAPMGNLRLLQINHVNLEGNFKHFPSELKWLQWKSCPLEAFPSKFCSLELAVLDLTNSKIKQVWEQRLWRGYKMAEKLKVLNLHGCCNLTGTPDFSGHPHLEKLILELCISLVKIHQSIGSLRKLTFLNLNSCSNLVEFPNDISGLTSLESFILSGCRKLKKLPNDLSSMKSLTNLLADQTAIEKLPDSICHLSRLERLSLNGCTALKQLPSSIGQLCSLIELSLNGSALEEIPDSVGSLTNLEILSLIRCESITAIPDSIGKLKSLLKLFLDGCSIESLPASIGSLSRLRYLSVGSCRSLSHLPVSIGGLRSVVVLRLDRTAISDIPDEIGNLAKLEKLEMRNCESVSYLVDSIGKMSCLTTLILVNVPITELPESMGQLLKLEVLNVNKCKGLCRLPAAIVKLNCLRELQMDETGVEELPKEFGMLSSLMVLKMAKRPHLEQPHGVPDHKQTTVLNGRENIKLIVLPDSFSRLSLLYDLDLRYCKLSGIIPDDFEKLSSLEDLKLDHNNFCSLPSSLRGLSLLKSLSLSHCRQLKCLPPLPSSLLFVDVTNCTALETISDMSNLESLQELRLTNCKEVKDIPGLECLNALRRLYMSGCSACFSAIKRRLLKVALKKLQNFSVPGSEIPNWLVQEVPSFLKRKHRQIRDVIVCVVISLQKQNQDAFSTLPAIVDIQAKILRDNNPIFNTTLYLMGVPDSHEDQIYLCRYLHYSPLVSLLEEGDKVQVTLRNPQIFQGLQLKKYGIHLVYEEDDDIDNDYEELFDENHETEQSVSGKLTRFFCSLEELSAVDSSCHGIERQMQHIEATEAGSCRAGREKHQTEEIKENNIKQWKSLSGVGWVVVILLPLLLLVLSFVIGSSKKLSFQSEF